MEPQKSHIEVSWAPDILTDISVFCMEQLDPLGDDQLSLAVQLVVEELVTNIFEHGYERLQGTVVITIEVDPGFVTLTILDQSLEFNPFLIVPEGVDPGEGGRGLSLVRQMADTTLYERTADGENILTCTFPRSTNSPVG